MKNKKGQRPADELQMGTRPDGWLEGDKFTPFDQMSLEELKRVKLQAQRRELFYINRSQVFSELVDKIDEEAEKRGATLPDRNTQFHRNTRKAKDAMKDS